MKLQFVRSAILAVVFSSASAATELPAVAIEFRDPASFTDAGPLAGVDPAHDRTLIALSKHVEDLAHRYLSPEESLRVEFLDIDLAGRLEPWRPYASDVRIMRDVTWPRMRLRYSLERDRQVIASAEDNLVDLNYLVSNAVYFSSDPLRFDKALLDKWFARRFDQRTSPSVAHRP